ncbi:LEF-4 [Plodia interpunctella granulovirus]|uniref:LEF-4 n=1 Tax=Plodia interpunctella granulovirus TaxID=262175 RepID=A0A1L5JH39_9BBAC|nr:LEF-4 [Plodia interpunctella granulovirus]APO13966.1 LEF-4 [Plodia interpunctella granulovirus]
MSIREQELSYTFTYSQDVLYKLKDWLDVTFDDTEKYVEVMDENDVRTRVKEGTILSSVKKKILDSSRFSVVVSNNIVPMIKRDCEEIVYTRGGEKIKRVCKTKVYRNSDRTEIKFEHIFFEHNAGDELDPLTVTKQLNLYNLLKPNKILDVTSNSHLGSDEILANCRLELEFENQIDQNLLLKTANLINHIETKVLQHVVITPFLSHTVIFNEICYRPFGEERLMGDSNNSDIKLWALKLDGIRGKAYIVNGAKIYIQLDDMQLFSGDIELVPKNENFSNFRVGSSSSAVDKNLNILPAFSSSFLFNRIVCVQIEYLCDTFFVTDILNVYKYNYDNRNQYDVSVPVSVNILDAIQFLNSQCDYEVKFNDYLIKFQRFYNHMKNVETREPNDGFVGITNEGVLIKIKHQKTFEMKYIGQGHFQCTFGTFHCNDNTLSLKPDKIYEVVLITDNEVRVIKERPDRSISN